MTNYQITGRVIKTERASNSTNGNPAYFVTVETCAGDVLRLRTAPDSSLGYSINNPEYREGLHEFHAAKSGKLMFARTINN
jgi:hypothetical protein